MENLIWLFVIFGVVAALPTIFKLYDQSRGEGEKQGKKKSSIEFFYKLKPYLFSKSEQVFYLELRKQVSDKYEIFSKVRIPDFIDVDLDKYRDKSRWQTHWNRIKSKHVDFLLCDPVSLKPLVAIELNGKSHNSEKMIARDKFVGEMYDVVGIKFVTFKVGDNFAEKIATTL